LRPTRASPSGVGGVAVRPLNPAWRNAGAVSRHAPRGVSCLRRRRDGAITDADLKLQRQINEAGARATALHSLLQFDLDGDGVITRAEVEAFFAGSLLMALTSQNGGEVSAAERQQLQAGIDQAMAPDTNGDGRIDFAEMLAYSEKRAIRYDGNPLLWVALTLDENKDGRVTLDEYLKAAEAAFHKVDSDGDGVLSKEEIDAFRKQQMRMPSAAK